MADFIPDADADYNNFVTTLAAYIAANPTALAVPAALQNALGDGATNWTNAYDAALAGRHTYEGLLAAKDTQQTALTAIIRQLNNLVQANTGVSDATRAAAGLPVHKTTRTPAPDIETHPVLYRVDNDHLLQRLWFSDSATPGSKAKPTGAAACEIRQALVAPGGAAPTDLDAMPFLALDTKSPHRTDFTLADVGKTAWYVQRWTNTRGVPGPWGPLTSYVVG